MLRTINKHGKIPAFFDKENLVGDIRSTPLSTYVHKTYLASRSVPHIGKAELP